MKKRTLTFLLALSILFMVSCDSNRSPFGKETNTTAEPQETTVPNQEEAPTLDGYLLKITTPEIFDYYLAQGYLDSYNGFLVKHDDLEAFGAFSYFDVTNSRQYRYDFFSVKNIAYSLKVEKNEEDALDWEYETNRIEEHPYSEMRTCQDRLYGYYYLTDDLRYLYLDGLLKRVEWKCGSILFTFYSPSRDLSDFPYDENSLASRLLDRKTAFAAKQEFDAMLAKLD